MFLPEHSPSYVRWVGNFESQAPIYSSKPHEIVSRIFENRGFTRQDILDMNRLSLEDITPELCMISNVELQKGTERMAQAVRKGEVIGVYTDYDVDGIASGVELSETLTGLRRQLGITEGRVILHLPRRLVEGHGFRFNDNTDETVMITADTGISDFNAAQMAKDRGIDLIITDHHKIKADGKVPDASAVIHSQSLCGTGVAFMFCRALLERFDLKPVHDHLGLVYLATVADLISLKGVSHVLARLGEPELRTSARPGFVEMCKHLNIDQSHLFAQQISFNIAPMFNSASRVDEKGSPRQAYKLLTSRSMEEAIFHLETLKGMNKKRQYLVRNYLPTLTEEWIQRPDKHRIIVMTGPEHEAYNRGFNGLYAGELRKLSSLPAVVVSTCKGQAYASARSIPGFDAEAMFAGVSDILTGYGGHEMAAGCSLPEDCLGEFKSRLEMYADAQVTDRMLVQRTHVDAVIPLKVIPDIFYQYSMLAPFGQGNPIPQFRSDSVTVESVLEKNEGRVLELKVSQKGNDRITAVCFNRDDIGVVPKTGRQYDMLYSVYENVWKGNVSLQLNVVKMGR